MGLNVSHDAFDGAYSAFNRFRGIIAKAMGGSWPPHEDKNLDDNLWYYDDENFSEKTQPGLFELMRHSDCDGYITPGKCKKVADELEDLLPKLEQLQETHGLGGGHIENSRGYVAVAKRFIAGCRLAHESKERLLFR